MTPPPDPAVGAVPIPIGGYDFADEIADEMVSICEASKVDLGITTVERYYQQRGDKNRQYPRASLPALVVEVYAGPVEQWNCGYLGFGYNASLMVLVENASPASALQQIVKIQTNVQAIFRNIYYNGTSRLLPTSGNTVAVLSSSAQKPQVDDGSPYLLFGGVTIELRVAVLDPMRS